VLASLADPYSRCNGDGERHADGMVAKNTAFFRVTPRLRVALINGNPASDAHAAE
jgi:hypothetical protein